MPQQKGFKRAGKVEKRKARIKEQQKTANLKRIARKEHDHDHAHEHAHEHQHA